MTKREIMARDEVTLIDSKDEVESFKFWENKQKEILTSVVDYNLDTLDSLMRKQTIDVKPKYQRRFRWDDSRKSKLIESFFMNVPVPPIFLNEDSYGKYSVIDGKQRLTAVSDFLNDRLEIKDLKVFSELNGRRFSDLPDELKAVITTRPTLRAIIVLRQSDSDIKFEVFARLNTGGISLNSQEIRNSTYTGSLNDLVLELSDLRVFHYLLGIKNKNSSAIYKEMKDAELVLRYLTFRRGWLNFKGGVSKTLDRFTADNRNLDASIIDGMRLDFLSTISKVELVFGEFAFRRWNPITKKWRSPILSSLYDTQMIALSYFEESVLIDNREQIVTGMQKLFEDVSFLKNLDSAIATYFIERIDKVKKMIEEVIA